jgi:hypothetical protein
MKLILLLVNFCRTIRVTYVYFVVSDYSSQVGTSVLVLYGHDWSVLVLYGHV